MCWLFALSFALCHPPIPQQSEYCHSQDTNTNMSTSPTYDPDISTQTAVSSTLTSTSPVKTNPSSERSMSLQEAVSILQDLFKSNNPPEPFAPLQREASHYMNCLLEAVGINKEVPPTKLLDLENLEGLRKQPKCEEAVDAVINAITQQVSFRHSVSESFPLTEQTAMEA